MRIHVISLGDSHARRASMAAQLDPLRLRYTMFDAIEGGNGFEFFDEYDRDLYRLNTGRVASRGEAGCFASHICLWERCVRSSRPIVVMEDDALLQENFKEALAVATENILEFGFIRLQTDGQRKRYRKQLIRRQGGFECHVYERYPYGAMAYAISPVVASRFIDRSRTLTGPVDLFIKQFWVHGQPLFGISPSPVQAGVHCEATTIPDRNGKESQASLLMRRAVHKLRGSLGRARFNRQLRAKQKAARRRPQPARETVRS